ncbi:MAG: hypothetical protein NTV02_03635 [Candidatus Zambryskibacteria bacterium]|nr:hypothetical protein [Candidatus Zambryskibacteria bacterium]
MIRNTVSILQDFLAICRSKFFFKKTSGYSFAFLVHSRGHRDIYRKYPFFKFLPKWLGLWIMESLWPITLSKVTGLKNIKDGSEVKGYVLGITMTAEQMMKKRAKALVKIRQAIHLARGKGVSLVGLGGLTSSLSGGGHELLDIQDVNITTGHAYTAYNVTETLFKVVDIFGVPKKKLTVGIVGAAGSVGTLSSDIVARAGYAKIVLIDVDRKLPQIRGHLHDLMKFDFKLKIEITSDIKAIKKCDLVITATNTPEALITPDLVSDGMVIVDDAQPSDIQSDVLKMPDVLVLEAGVVHTPEVHSNFNYGLKSRTDNFCCMAELLILASHSWNNHYVVRRATLAHVDEISAWGKELGFTVAAFQNFQESITPEKLERVKIAFQKKHESSS